MGRKCHNHFVSPDNKNITVCAYSIIPKTAKRNKRQGKRKISAKQGIGWNQRGGFVTFVTRPASAPSLPWNHGPRICWKQHNHYQGKIKEKETFSG
jgi:hypothetical protein